MSLALMVTGFEPFRHHRVNPSWHAAEFACRAHGSRAAAFCLPVDHLLARRRLLELLQLHNPRACLCTGLAAGDVFRIELRARKPLEFEDLPGAVEHPGVWSWEQMESSLQAEGVPVRRSEDAGRYVCESTYWSLLDHMQGGGLPRAGAFLHVPALSERFQQAEINRAVARVVADAL